MNYGQAMVLQKHNAYDILHVTTEMSHNMILLIQLEVKGTGLICLFSG